MAKKKKASGWKPAVRKSKKFMFVRCAYPECYAILLKGYQVRGGCECGLNKFRGVPLGAGKLTPQEEKLFEHGLVHLIDMDMIPPDPDLLNLDNPKYWRVITRDLGRNRSRAKKRKAEKKRKDLERWLAEQERISGLNVGEIIQEAKDFDRDRGL